MQDTRLIRKRHRFRIILRPNHLQLPLIPRLQILENVLKHPMHHLQRLHVMLVNRHLQIQPGKLAQMPPRMRILRAEHRSYLEDPFQIGRNGHLLVQLRRLRQTRRRPEVIGGKHPRAAFALPGDEFGGVYLDKSLFVERLPKELTHRRLDSHDGVVGRGAQIEPPVIETEFLSQAGERPIGVLALFHFLLGAGGVFDEEGEHGIRFGDGVDARDGELGILDGAAADVGGGDDALHVDDGFGGEGFEVFDHFGGEVGFLFVFEEAGLDGVEGVLAEDEEAGAAFDADGGDAAAKPHFVAGAVLFVGGGGVVAADVGDVDELAARSAAGHDGGHVAHGFVGVLFGEGEVGHVVDAVGFFCGGFLGGFFGGLFGFLAFFFRSWKGK